MTAAIAPTSRRRAAVRPTAARASVRLTGLLLAAALAPAVAQAQSGAEPQPYATQVWINPGIYSRHFKRDLGLRENNYGFGVEVGVAPEHAAIFGEYRNSDDRPTRYLGWYWKPLQWGPVRAGVIVSGFDGYPKMHDGGWFLAAVPAASLEYGRLGVNLTIVPGYKDRLYGAVAIQAKLRVW